MRRQESDPIADGGATRNDEEERRGFRSLPHPIPHHLGIELRAIVFKSFFVHDFPSFF